MALNTRLTQNIDLQADGSALVKALGSIESALNNIVRKSGTLSQNMESGAKAGSREWNNQLKQLNILIGQAQNLQKILDGQRGKRAGKLLEGLEEQSLGKKGAAASRLAQGLTATSSAADVLEKRLALLNKRFAELTLAGRTIGQRDLAKQLKTQEALKQVTELQRAFQKLNGQAAGTSRNAQSEDMKRLRTEIEKANAELATMGRNYRRTDFQPQITQLRTLTEQYRQAVSAAASFDRAQPGRARTAQTTAVGILNQNDAQRLASIQRASSQFQFPAGVSNTVSQQSAENRLAESLNKRLRLLNMIQAAQDRGAPTRSVERLNDAYKRLGMQLGEDYKLLTQVNKEINNTPQARAEKARQQIKEVLFGDGGVGLAQRIGFASVITTGVFAVINALKDATKFVIEYEAALKRLQAISGSTDAQMSTLAKGIGNVARNSNYATLEIVKAAQTIAQAGYSAQETGQVLEATMTLATASGTDPQQSADILTSTLGAFQLQATESARVADVLVTALNRTKLSMDQVQAAIQYAGATAKESNVSFDELTTIIAAMAQAGIRSGSTIGTGLRQLLVDLQTPTEDFKKSLKDVGLTLSDVDVKSKGFVEVIRTLTDAGFGATQAYSSFETRAAAAFLAFKGQLPVYDQLALSITQGGAAAEAQAKAMDSLSAQFTRLTNDLGILIAGLAGPLVDALKVATSLFATFVEGIIDLAAPFANVIGQMGIFGEVLKTAVFTGIGLLVGGPLGAAIGLFIGLSSAISGASNRMDELETATSDAAAKLTSQQQTVSSLDDAIKVLVDRQDSLKDGSVALQTETATLSGRFEKLSQYLDTSRGKYDELLSAMLRYRREALAQTGLDAQVAKSNAQAQLTEVQKQLQSGPGISSQLRAGGINPDSIGGRNSESYKVYKQGTAALEAQDQRTVTNALVAVQDYSSKNNNSFRALVTLLNERLGLIKQAASLQAQIGVFDTQISTAEAASSPEAQQEYERVTGFRGKVDKSINYNGPDRLNFLRQNIGAAKGEITRLTNQLNGTGDKGKKAVIQNDIDSLNQELARLQTALRQATEEKPEKAKKGFNLTGEQVAANLRKAYPGANPYSYQPRSLAKQKQLYAAYTAGTGPLAAKPGTSMHGNGHALDMTPLKGVSIDEVTAYLESLGLEVVERLNELDPKTGRYHWHFGWKAKTSSFKKQQDNSLDELRKAQASASVNASSSQIQAILAQGKAGIGTPDALNSQLSSAIGDYTKNSLAKYDVEHPSAGLSGNALKLQQIGRTQLQKDLAADAEKFRADLYRAIGDAIEKTFDASIQMLDAELERKTYAAGAGLRTAESRMAVAASPLNQNRVGAGTTYYLQQQRDNAALNTDRATVALQDNTNARKALELDSFKADIDKLPAGEDKEAKLAKWRQAVEALNVALQKTDELQQSINDRTTVFNQLPLEDRLKNAATAWANNSGVMQDWTTVMENNVGPALDMMTNTLTDVFSQIMTGSMGIKGALKAIISAVGQFVVQLIAKALALMAIKWFLSLIGVNLVDGPGGVTLGKKMKGGAIEPQKKMNGGLIKMMGGGSTGYISEGVKNRDSVPILGARGEYMLRSAAVDSLGLQNVDALNRHGAKALSKMTGAVPMMGANNQEMNVYIIKPEEKPQLGPKDMVLAITDDMLQGGVTKQLVRKISQGAM